MAKVRDKPLTEEEWLTIFNHLDKALDKREKHPPKRQTEVTFPYYDKLLSKFSNGIIYAMPYYDDLSTDEIENIHKKIKYDLHRCITKLFYEFKSQEKRKKFLFNMYEEYTSSYRWLNINPFYEIAIQKNPLEKEKNITVIKWLIKEIETCIDSTLINISYKSFNNLDKNYYVNKDVILSRYELNIILKALEEKGVTKKEFYEYIHYNIITNLKNEERYKEIYKIYKKTLRSFTRKMLYEVLRNSSRHFTFIDINDKKFKAIKLSDFNKTLKDVSFNRKTFHHKLVVYIKEYKYSSTIKPVDTSVQAIREPFKAGRFQV
jgi:hypothetical protein